MITTKDENRKNLRLKFRISTISIFVLCILIVSVSASAQDETPTPSATPDDALISAIDLALENHRAIPGNPLYYRYLGATVGENGAMVYVEPRSQANEYAYPGVVDWAVALRENGEWQVYLPGNREYMNAYQSLPRDVVRSANTTQYLPRANPALTPNLNGYDLPWENGRWGTVVRSYERHGIGHIDFDLNGGAITAAKDGRIVYANDSLDTNGHSSGAWWYWNTIIIQHADHEYSLYGHLAHDSIPETIKAGCTDNYALPNCNVPVNAGQVIALEGNTGYSTSPHLHVEFGQAYAIVPYMDTADHDRDGVRAEIIYSPYIYAEHNVPLDGVRAEDVAWWQWGDIFQAAHLTAPPPNYNLILNGSFDNGTDGWRPSGQINWQVEPTPGGNVLRATRLQTEAEPRWASFFQVGGYGVRANTTFEVNVRLGNASGIAKTVTLSLYNGTRQDYDQITCVFDIPPNTPLTAYAMRGRASKPWASLMTEISINPPDGSPAALIDDVAVFARPTIDAFETECLS